MRMESKSAIKLARSYGLLRYKVVSSSPAFAGVAFRRSSFRKTARTAENPTTENFLLPGQEEHRLKPMLLVGGLIGRRLLALHQLDVEAERLQLADEHVERFGNARLDARFALDDGLVDFRAAIDVVGLRGQEFLQNVRGAIGFERPDFHFAEPLPAELRLAAQRLLGDERVRPDGASVDLVVDQVRELEHVDVADGDGLIELFAGHAVEQVDFAGVRQARDFQQVADFRFARAVEYGRGEGNAFLEAFGIFQQLVVAQLRERLPDCRFGEDFAVPAANRFGFHFLAQQALQAVAEFPAGPAQVRFENLSDVHTRRNAERVQNDFHRRAIRERRHIFFRNDARDDALVTVAAGHFVADGELALHGDVDLDQLDDARGQFVALLELFLALLGDLAEHIDLARGHLLDFFDLFDQERILLVELQTLQVARGDLFDQVAREFDALGQQALVGLFVVQVGLENLAAQQIAQALQALVGEDADFVRKVPFELEDLRGLDGLVALVFFSALAGEDLDVHDGAFDTRRAVERSVAHVAGFFAEDGAEEFLFRRQGGFALGRNFANEDVARLHDRADADDAAFVEVAKERLADVGDVASDFLGAQLRVARFDFILLDVDGGVVIVLHQLFADEDGVFEVVPAPGHEGHQHVAAEAEFPAVRAGTVGEHLRLFHAVAHASKWLLVDAGVLVGALELCERVNVRTNFAAEYAGVVAFDAHDDALGVDLVHDAVALAEHDRAGIAGGDALHAGADERRFAANQRHGLALHVGAHQGAVGVVVFEERDQAGGDGNELLRRDVDIVDFIAMLQHEVSGLAAVDEFRGDLQTLVERNVGLGDDVLVLFPCRKIEAIGFVDDLAALQLIVELFDAVAFDDVPGLELAVAGVDDVDVVNDASTLHTAIGRFDEAVIVDAGKAAERADQADVRTFRRFNRADAAVVRRVNVAHFETRALAREATGSKGRKTALVGDFAERVGLVHELAQLRASEEFADGRHDRLGVDQVVRHGRGHFLVHAHLFLDGAFHADQADAKLVFEKFTDRADAAVAEMVDVVHHANVLAQLEEILDGRNEVGGVQGAIVERGIEPHLDVELQAADAAEIVLARIEEHAAEEIGGRFERRGIAGAQLAIDFDQRFLGRADGILVERAGEHQADVVTLREEDVDFGDAALGKRLPEIGGQRLVGLEQDFAGLAIDDVGDAVSALEVGKSRANLGDLGLDQFLEEGFGDALVRADDHFFRLGIADFVGQLAVHDTLRNVPEQFLVAQGNPFHLVKGAEDFFIGLHAQRAQEDGAEELALAVNAHVENVLGVVLEFHPRAAVRNDLAEEVGAIVGAFEKDARRTMQLADDDALGAVDDEGAVIGHQRDVAVENFLLLDVANGFRAGVRVFIVYGETNSDLERGGIRHAALLALVHVVLQLHGNRVAALVAEGRRILVEGAALLADHIARLIRIGDDGSAAIPAGGAQVVQTLQVAALALPVSDRVIHEFELRHFAEVPDRKHRREHRLKAAVIALAWQQIHLQKALIGLLLDLNQVGDLDGSLDFCKIQSLAFPNVLVGVGHS